MPKKPSLYSNHVINLAFIFIVTQIFALLLSIPLKGSGAQAFDNPDDPANMIWYVLLMLLFTGGILLLIKYGLEKFIKYLMLVMTGYVLFFVLLFTYFYGIYYLLGFLIPSYEVLDALSFFLAVISAVVLTALVHYHPEWYVMNTVGIIMGAGVAAVLGISFGIIPILLFLVILAVYDAVAVYRTKHMLSLAEMAITQRLPMLFVVPRKKGYSYRSEEAIKILEHRQTESGAREVVKKQSKNEATFMGLGDVAIPGALAVSAMTFLSGEPTFLIVGNDVIVALCTIAGGLIGYLALMNFVLKGRPQAGLPLLNTGAISGFLISYFILFVV